MRKSLFIEKLMNKNDCTLADTALYYHNNKNQIDSMMEIFNEENELQKEYISAIPLLLNSESASVIQKYYLPEHKTEEELSKHKLMLLTALQYNNQFFVYACNWCSYTLYKAMKEKKSAILSPDWQSIFNSEILIERAGLAAASKNEAFVIFEKSEKVPLTIKFDENNNEMYFIYEFAQEHTGKNACVKISTLGLTDLKNNEISEILIEGEIDELGEVHKIIKANFSSNFKILQISVKL